MRRGLKLTTPNFLKAAGLLALSAWSSGAHAASFDCSKASNYIERQICDDTHLSELDEILHKEYQLAQARVPSPSKLKQEQRNWLKNTRSQCADSQCLRDVHIQRITALMSKNSPDLIEYYQTDSKPQTLAAAPIKPNSTPSGKATADSTPKSTGDKSGIFMLAIAGFVIASVLTPKVDRRFKTGFKNNKTVPRIVPWLYFLSVISIGYAFFA